MRIKLLLITLLCILFMASCGSRRTEDEGYANGDYGYFTGDYPVIHIPRMVYIALGDSVSEGFGIWTESDRHTHVFFNKLLEHEIANYYVNYAISGFTTTDLLNLLHNLNENDLENFRDATVITLNIGGNNILAPFFESLPDTYELQRIATDTIEFATYAWSLVNEILEFINESRDSIADVLEFAYEVVDFIENFGVLDVFRINAMAAAATPILDGAMEVFEEINQLESTVADVFNEAANLEILDFIYLFTGDIPNELEANFQLSIDEFQSEFIQILDWITAHAPNALVIANTVYNPLPPDVIGLPISFALESNRIIQALNRIIYEEVTERGFIVSDVYNVLSHRLDMMNMNFDLIHPNPNGHEIIASMNFEDLMDFLR